MGGPSTGRQLSEDEISLEIKKHAATNFPPIDPRHPSVRYQWNNSARHLTCFDPSGAELGIATKFAASILAWRQGRILIHGAGLRRNAVGILCLAPSGGGKSTLSDLCVGFDCLGDEAQIVSPNSLEGTAIRSASRRSPVLIQAPFSHCLFLEKASSHPSFTPLSSGESFSLFLPQVFAPPAELATTQDVFRRCAAILAKVKCHKFAFPKGPTANEALLAFCESSPP